MSLDLSGGRLRIDKDGITRLNTDDLLLHGAASGFGLSGSVSIPAHTGGNSDDGGPGRINITTTWDLGAVPAGHTQIIGACKFDLNNDAAALAFDRWHTVMGGTIVWVMDGEPAFAGALGDNGASVKQYCAYEFRISGGQAQLVRRLFIADTPNAYTILAHEITYKLRSGNWT